MDEDELQIPEMFFEVARADGRASPGALYVKLYEKEETVLLGSFGLVEEACFIDRNESDNWVFTAADDDRIDKPPFERIFEADKSNIRERLHEGECVYGAALREAWDNWSEGDIFRFRLGEDEREFEATHERLMKYDRHEYFREQNA